MARRFFARPSIRCPYFLRAFSLLTIPAKHILHRTPSKAWFGVEYNCNLYRGCTHGCIYCDSRSLCYQNPDFERVYAKENALETLRVDLAATKQPGVVGTGSMSDPYNPLEAEARLTQGALKLFLRYGFGVHIASKSDLVTRDAGLLAELAAGAPVLVNLTVTCAEDALQTRIEPGAPASSRRFAALSALAGRGIPCGILLMPVLPFLSDTPENITAIVRRAADCGVSSIAAFFGMTLRAGSREHYYHQLQALFPGLPARYAKAYGARYELPSLRAAELQAAFEEACRKAGILWRMPEIIDLYQGRFLRRQTSLFDESRLL